MINLETIRLRLADAIKHSQLSQCELSKSVGVNQSQISCYLHGKKLPALETFAKLCAVLDVDPAYILGLE